MNILEHSGTLLIILEHSGIFQKRISFSTPIEFVACSLSYTRGSPIMFNNLYCPHIFKPNPWRATIPHTPYGAPGVGCRVIQTASFLDS